MKAAWVDGSFAAGISPHDAGYLRGHGVFETLGVFAGALPLWSAHLARLHHNAAALGIACEVPADLAAVAVELLRRQPGDDIVRITLTAGCEGRPTWCLTTAARAAGDTPLRLHPVRHVPPATAAIKTTSRACYEQPWRLARAAGAADALLVAADGGLLETTRGNVFCSRDGVLRTPPLDGRILPGVGRAALIRGLAAEGLAVEETHCPLAAVAEGAGFFITNAVYGPRPAALVGGAPPLVLDSRVAAAWQRVIA